MKYRKIMMIVGTMALFVTGCSKPNDNEEAQNTKQSINQNTSSQPTEKVNESTAIENDSDNVDIVEIDVDELLKKMDTSKETVFFVGNSQSSEYQVALKEAKSICSELSIDLYQTDLGQDTSKKIAKKYQANFSGELAEPYDILACNQEGKLTPLEPFDERMPAEIRRNLFKVMVQGKQIVD
ncbi:hypothetical protein ACYSNW_13485 [Enterococcus sp. LJL99]